MTATPLRDRIAALRACRACAADRADIGAFDRGIPHTFGSDCTVPEWRRRALAGALHARVAYPASSR